MASTRAPRYAVYFAPEAEHPLWRAGCIWLGRDPADPAFVAAPRDFTDAPRRYGFHATLKAPMVLRAGATAHDFVDAVAVLASSCARFVMPALEVATLGNFVALRPRSPVDATHPLRRLADTCVRELDNWRAAPTANAAARQEAEQLDPARRALHERWGYPHVLDQWRFHMTLSDGFADDPQAALRRAATMAAARAHFASALLPPLHCHSLCVFSEEAPGAAFKLIRRMPLVG